MTNFSFSFMHNLDLYALVYCSFSLFYLFQEVDRFHDLEEELTIRGYAGIWKVIIIQSYFDFPILCFFTFPSAANK